MNINHCNILKLLSIEKEFSYLIFILGDFNIADKDWAQSLAVSTDYFCETEKFLTAKNIMQLITETIHEDVISWTWF